MDLNEALELLVKDQICIHLLTEDEVICCMDMLGENGFHVYGEDIPKRLIEILCEEVRDGNDNGVVIYGEDFLIEWNHYNRGHINGMFEHHQVPVKFADITQESPDNTIICDNIESILL